MSGPRRQTGFGGVIFFVVAIGLGLLFHLCLGQGDYGLFRRIQIDAEAEVLRGERDRLVADINKLSNKTLRLSDDYLDLDLLDQQAREVLGMVRSDEVVLR